MKMSLTKLAAQFFFILLIVSTLKLNAQNKVEVAIDPFDQVKVSDDLKIVFKKSDKEHVTIVANGIGYDKIITESSGRILRIKVKSGFYKATDVQVLVEYVTIRSLEASNKADVSFEEVLEGDQLELKAVGSAVINLKADISALKASLSNGGRIEISGKAEIQEVDASLGSKYNAYEFETENGFIKSNTNSDVVVWVKNKLEATASSKGNVKYRGKPADLKTGTNLGGKISGDI